MAQIIYNSLTRNKDPFTPAKPGEVGIYVCGPTVYDLSHIGHARVYVAFDTIVRFLRRSATVTYVRNYTDVDDKIIARAQKENHTPQEVAEHNIAEFRHDMTSLGVAPADHEPKVTEHVAEVIAICQDLVQRGIAYPSGGDLYYAVEKFAEYGKLGRRTLEDMEAGIRVELNSQKRHPMDFVLWKAAKPGEPAWEAPWGRGRPGWHIECSAMAKKYLGATFDLHGGGRDLMFPHHENEIAQSEAASGVPFSHSWMHGGLVKIDNEKMSKSLGNFFTIRQVLEKFDAQALRYSLLTTHYRSSINFSDAMLSEAQARVAYCYRTLARIDERVGEHHEAESSEPDPATLRDKALATIEQRFHDAMEDDFNTPEAFGALSTAFTAANEILDRPKEEAKDVASLRQIRRAIVRSSEVLGLFQEAPGQWLARFEQRQVQSRGLNADEIEGKLREREEARKAKDFTKADGIRRSLEQRGVLILDRDGKTEWRMAEPAAKA